VAGQRDVGGRLERAIEDRADLEGEIARGEAEGPPERRHLVRSAIGLGLTAISLYLVAPSLLDTLSSWRDLEKLAPAWLIAMAVRGAVPHDLVNATLIGAAVFAVLAVLGAWCLRSDRPLRTIGRLVQRIRNRLRPKVPPLTGLPKRLLRERDRVLATLGPQWLRALLATTGRWAFDYATLLAALAAVGSHPRASLVLLAFCAAQLLSQIPVTPGGLGFVEAGLTATLTLAGVSPGNAVLATFAYRLFAFWLPLPAGLVAYAVHRRALARAG
jgi:uncharacterized membrane protein YbhN (UPF0104 family)